MDLSIKRNCLPLLVIRAGGLRPLPVASASRRSCGCLGGLDRLAALRFTGLSRVARDIDGGLLATDSSDDSGRAGWDWCDNDGAVYSDLR